MKSQGFETTTNGRCIQESTYLNIYGYPEELDYTDVRPIPDKWFGVDAFMRKGEQELKLPKEFQEKLSKNEGKLIYLSLGSMGSVDVQLMKRLVNILSKTKHK